MIAATLTTPAKITSIAPTVVAGGYILLSVIVAVGSKAVRRPKGEGTAPMRDALHLTRLILPDVALVLAIFALVGAAMKVL